RGLAPQSDVLKAFPALVRDTLALRRDASAKADAAQHRGDPRAAARHQAAAQLAKRFLVSAYGTTGWSHARFVDPTLRANIAARGRQIAGAVKDALGRADARVLAIETDGFYVEVSDGAAADTLRVVAEQAAIAALGLSGIEVRASSLADAALILPNAKALSNGTRKGGLTSTTSLFNGDVRERLTELLLH